LLRFKNLASGSSGNATLVQCQGSTRSTHLLIDCGLSLRLLKQKLAAIGLNTQDIDAVFITHEHADHIGSAFTLAIRHQIPIFLSHGTWQALQTHTLSNDKITQYLHFVSDASPVDIGDIQIRPFTVPHDAQEPLQLVCTDGQVRLGILTDIGHPSHYAIQNLQACHAILLECNHDLTMLQNNPRYPLALRQRIEGDYGHLANTQAVQILARVLHQHLKHVVAVHLSTQNNTPSLVQETLSQVLCCRPNEVLCADQTQGSPWLDIG
jgi:phosphoribosyl 1,2-cyclic phosphodiesterase